MVVKNLAAFDAAIRAVCPHIDGVDAEGGIFFTAQATAAEKAAAQTAAASYVDPQPALIADLDQLLVELANANVLSAAAIARVRKPPPPSAPPPPITGSA